MATYTTELRTICESYAGLKTPCGYAQIESVIAAAVPQIFEDFPIYAEEHRAELCTKIIKHYFFQEIAFETVARWKFRLNETMNLIMPYYNQLYESATAVVSPLLTVNVKETESGMGTDRKTDVENRTTAKDGNTSLNVEETQNTNVNDSVTTNNSGTTEVDYTSRYSDTPQGALQNIQNNTYLTDATIDDTDTTTTTTGQTDSTSTTARTTGTNRTGTSGETGSEDVQKTSDGSKEFATTREKVGYEGSASKLLKEWRENILNIDYMIVHELSDLFMGVW